MRLKLFHYPLLFVLCVSLIYPFPRAYAEPDPTQSCAEHVAQVHAYKIPAVKDAKSKVKNLVPLWKRIILLPSFFRMRSLLDEEFHRRDLNAQSPPKEIEEAWEAVYARAWGDSMTNWKRGGKTLTMMLIAFPLFLGLRWCLKSVFPKDSHESLMLVLGMIFGPPLLSISAGLLEVLSSSLRRKSLSYGQMSTLFVKVSLHYLQNLFYFVQATSSVQQHGRMHASFNNTNFNAFIFWAENYFRAYLKSGSQSDLEAAVSKLVGALTVFRKQFPDFFEAALQGIDTTPIDHANRVLRETLGQYASSDEITEIQRSVLRAAIREDELGGNHYVSDGYNRMVNILFGNVRETSEAARTARAHYFRSTLERAQHATRDQLAPYKVVLKAMLDKAKGQDPKSLDEYHQILDEMFAKIRHHFTSESQAYHELFLFLVEIDPSLRQEQEPRATGTTP